MQDEHSAAAGGLPTFADVARAAERIAGVAHRTPVLTSRTADAMTGAQLFFKAENLQRAGAFKFRGAYNAISALPEAARARGVITFSSGNHAQAIALASRLLGIAATIIMPARRARREDRGRPGATAPRSSCTTATARTGRPSAGRSPSRGA